MAAVRSENAVKCHLGEAFAWIESASLYVTDILMCRLFGCCLLFFVAAEQASSAETVQLPVTQDNSIVLVDGEWKENAGQQGRIRIKGNQHLVAMSFDTSAITGRRVKKATLVCVQGEKTISGVSISTIACPWDENRSNGLTAGVDGIADWGYTGARFPAVSGGNGFTLVHQSDSNLQDGIYHWDVQPDLVHAMAIGIAHGLAIHEHDADYGRNPTIFSREQSGKKPYLLVELDDSADPLPSVPTNLQLAGIDGESARLILTAPANAFAFEVMVDGYPLGRHNIPMASPNKAQTILLRDLPESFTAGETQEVKVVALNRCGRRSEPVTVRGPISRAVVIEKPAVTIASQKSPIADVGIIPVTDKYDSEGKPIGNLPDDYRVHNSVYDGQQVRLTAAAGEVIGFQMLLKGSGDAKVSLAMEDASVRTDMWQALYVQANGRKIPDPLLPLPQKISLTNDTDQVVVTDIYIPFQSSPGLKKGSISISDGRMIPLEVDVLPFSLPRQATFFCEMNGYGLPDHVDEYYALQQIAYDHRVHANILHYSHNTAAPGSRKSNLDMRLRSGRRMDNRRYDDISPDATAAFWDDFAEAFGPYIDGSLFRDGHRGPIPAPGFYLTFHESWPLNCRAYFNGNPDAYQAFSDQPEYARTWVNIMRSFAELAEARQWTQTGFQVYFNNKGSLQEKTKAPWILDEPSSYWDYRALQFYGELMDRGCSTVPGVQVDYRIDISRPEFTRGQLAARNGLWVVSTWAFQHYRRLVTDRVERDGLNVWIYGSSNHVHETNRNIQAWALDAFQDGATGIVPWQTVNKTGSALREADQLGLFIFDHDASGASVIRHSLRLKAYREAQQLIEYLHLLKQVRGWSHSQMKQFIGQYVQLNAEVEKVNEADAGTTKYSRFSSEGLESLRLAAARLLRQP